MVRTRSRIRKTVAQLVAASVVVASFGAAVVAAPSLYALKAQAAQKTAFHSLAGGPTLQLAKVGPGLSEDCVRVTSVIGPDGKSYPTNGVVCGGE